MTHGPMTPSPGNDPVMGGQSKSTFALDQGGSGGMFAGTCAVVPFLKAPGFCKVETTGGSFPDASAYFSGSLAMRVRSTTPTYAGFKVAFGATGATRPAGTGTHHGGATFKAPFQLRGSGWQVVKIPFSQFSIDWSDYTGSCSTKDPTGVQHHCCTAAHPEVCVQLRHLKAVTSLGVWAEGVEGTFDLDIDWIGADESADVGVSQD